MEREGETGDRGEAIERWSAEGLVGTVEHVLERMTHYAEAGVQRVMLQHLVHQDLETVELIGTGLVPEAAAL
jgi:alkanesulfonate monooxygenase SsuD/methylene tetrahydromethanopterin reductase-like flavin-dependent oxidoreductase (luciferase family)